MKKPTTAENLIQVSEREAARLLNICGKTLANRRKAELIRYIQDGRASCIDSTSSSGSKSREVAVTAAS